MSARRALTEASRMSQANARTYLRSLTKDTDATERRIFSIRCDEPEAFQDICEAAGIPVIGEPPAPSQAPARVEVRRGAGQLRYGPSGRLRPVQDSILQAFLDRWRIYPDVVSELGKPSEWISRQIARTCGEGMYRMEKRRGAQGTERRLVRVQRGFSPTIPADGKAQADRCEV